MDLFKKIFSSTDRLQDSDANKLSKIGDAPRYLIEKLDPIYLIEEHRSLDLKNYLWKANSETLIPAKKDSVRTLDYLIYGKATYVTMDFVLNASDSRSRFPLDCSMGNGQQDICLDRNSVVLRLPGGYSKHSKRASINDLDFQELKKTYPSLTKFFDHILHDSLVIPSVPTIAIELQQLIIDTCNINDVVNIMELDASLAVRVVNIANSAYYCHLPPVESSKEAVMRLGMTITRNLLIGMYLRKVFSCSNFGIMQRVKKFWGNSLGLSNYMYLLAMSNRHPKMSEASLVGLVGEVGAIPLLSFLSSLPEEELNKLNLDSLFTILVKPITAYILEKWGLPKDLCVVALTDEAAYYTDSDELSLLDIANLSKLGLEIDTAITRTTAPLIWTLPAFKKLANQKLDDLNLACFKQAKDLSAETLKAYSL